MEEDLTRPERLGPALARATGDDRWLTHDARLIAGGKSNLTFELSSAAGSLILRRPPTGELLPRAHDMGREVRVQRALHPTAVPVPCIVYAETEPHLLDVAFYVMEKVPGIIIADSLPAGYAVTAEERTALADALIDGLVALHTVDPAAIGLSDYGRPAGFLARQVRTWTRQWHASKMRDVPAVDDLAARLTAHEWREDFRASIVHGDYRLDNCVFDAEDPRRLRAVLDWELSTLGDPLADLASLLLFWVEAGEPEPALTPALTRETGFPSRAHLIARYADASGTALDDLDAYVAFAHFKMAVITQGIAARVAAGQMAGQSFGDLIPEVERLAEEGVAALNAALAS
ncbi:phosphotransferase family protein [Microbacterium sp. No. 7]|uniref:phosphotransferase family protein n=1 Tax=Microbacterium sp. No. 7 TaxID=1714373 RepID=UPI0006D15432|nr:phosphotransferase family protein [Microbacterium sp. No. 7]ALJ21893.1 aminoglycoside phosphotransferase [Microbacterium sp. No. 7]